MLIKLDKILTRTMPAVAFIFALLNKAMTVEVCDASKASSLFYSPAHNNFLLYKLAQKIKNAQPAGSCIYNIYTVHFCTGRM